MKKIASVLAMLFPIVVYATELNTTTRSYSIVLGASRVVMKPGNEAYNLPVENKQDYPVLIETTILNEDSDTKSNMYVVTPPLFRLDGGQKNSISIIKENNDLSNLGLIIVATTSSKNLMPGIANEVQKSLKIKSCISLDILAGCSGFINSFDIARLYLESGKVEKALVIGVDLLSKTIDKEDLGTAAVLSDGAGGILIEKAKENKKYFSNIKA